MNRALKSFFLFLIFGAAISADVVTVDPAGVTTVGGTAPATAPAAGEVKIGGGDVVIGRTTPATGPQVVRGDDVRLLPSGVVMPYAGTTLPPGWLLCDGSAISRASYPNLFARIGTTFGAGDGATTFNLPNLSGRVAVGSGAGAGLTPRTIGGAGGEESHTLTIAEMPAHSHGIIANSTDAGYNGLPRADGSYSNAPSNTQSTGGNQPHNVMQPFLVLHYIIKD